MSQKPYLCENIFINLNNIPIHSMKASVRFISLLLLTFAMLACNEKATYRIGISQCSNDDWRNKMNEEIMREALFHDNLEIEIRSAEDNNEKQIEDLCHFANSGYDIIIVAPNEEEPLTPIIDSLYLSGMPIIVFDRSIRGDNYTAFQGADNLEIGCQAAKLASSLLTDNRKVIEICGLPGSTPAHEREMGFDKEASELGIDIVAHADGNWNAEEAEQVADSLLNLYPDVGLIYAHNDRMAIAASLVAKHKGLNHVKVIGIDAAPNIGIKAVADTIIDATFLYPTQGYQLVRTALDILQGKEVPKKTILPTPAAVDLTNAQILLLQDQSLKEETNKITWLKSQVDAYWEQHALTKALLIGAIIILVLLSGLIFLLLRMYRNNVRHRKEIEIQNHELSNQRDQLNDLYSKLQEATTSKLVFFTNVSHDLRTPLTLIAAPIQQLENADNLTFEQHNMLKMANKNVKILLRLVNQILDFRKYDNGKLALNLNNVNLAEALRDWIPAFENIARMRHIQFNLFIKEGEEFVTAVDVEKIERVLFNLLSNAFKFTPENGSITVTLYSDTKNLFLSVKDTGRGMSSEEIEHIFERFYQTTQVNPNGSGIGLALTKVFVEMHGGAIQVKSDLGVGSEFIVSLPIRRIEGEIMKSATIASCTTDPVELAEIEDNLEQVGEDTPTILVIDDNPDICVLVKNILSSEYKVIQAMNGDQGIRLATRYVPDMIVCDVMMPGIDGYETCRQLKNEVETSHIPVLLLTACSTDEQRIKGYEAGADGYLPKPFDARVLIAKCHSLIENRRRLGQIRNTEKHPVDLCSTQTRSATIDNEFYQKFEAIILKEIGNSEISVEEIASRLGMSRVQMYRKIKGITNYSPAEQIRIIRLKHAAHLLKTTTNSVSEIGYAVGFTTPSYFTKCYKEYFNETPTETQARTSRR